MVTEKILKILTWIFYLFFIFLWFKGNIPALSGIRIGLSTALFPLALLLLVRIVMYCLKKRIIPPFKIDRKWIGLAVILLLAICFRIPFLSHSFGLVSSDVAIPCLMGKHIAQAGQPPVYYYGQLYLGSLASHFYALVFFLFPVFFLFSLGFTVGKGLYLAVHNPKCAAFHWILGRKMLIQDTNGCAGPCISFYINTSLGFQLVFFLAV